MKAIYTIIVSVLCYILVGTSIIHAQGQERKFQQERKGIFFHDKKVKLISNSNALKFKYVVDNDISEWLQQYYYNEEWYDDYKSEYEYSADRLTIEVTDYYYYEEATEGSAKGNQAWEKEANITVKFTEEGFPLSIEYVYADSSEIWSEHFYYTETGRPDSVIFTEIYAGEEYRGKFELHYVTDDSIRVVSYEDGEISEEGSFVNKDGNFIETYDDGEFKERYTYYDLTFEDFLKGLYDEFFFYNYNYLDEEYDAETESWIPYIRGTYTKEDGRITEYLEEWYDVEEEKFYPEYLAALKYEDGVITEILDMFNSEGENPEWNQEYRSLFTYSGSVSNERSDLVNKFSLSQNFPNPFNPTTNITYSLPVSGEVKLKVYNVIGIEVAELLNGYTPAGDHSVVFDAQSLTSGIYYYRLSAPGYSVVKSMTLIK